MRNTTAPSADRQREIAELQRELRDLQEQRMGAIRVKDRDPGMGELVQRLDQKIAAAMARFRELRPPTPGEQLAELEIEIAGLETELGRLNVQRSAAAEAVLKREPEADDRLQEIAEEIETAVGRMSVLRDRRAQLQQHIAGERAADAQRAAEAKPARFAELHRERVAHAERLTQAARTLAAAVRAIDANGATLAELLDDQGARNFLSVPALRRRAANALAREFAINPNATLTVGNSMFGIASDAVGAASHWTLTQWEQQGLDDLVPFFATEVEAEEGRRRLELRATPTVVVPLHGAFTLVRFEQVFGDQASATRAAMRSTTPMAVVPHGPGFVLLPARFVEAA